MKILSSICGVATIFLLVISYSVEPSFAGTPKVGGIVPSWSKQSLGGDQVNFPSDLKGEPAILLFWASWCPYCKALLKEIESINSDFPSLPIYAVNFASDEREPNKNPIARLPFTHLFNADDVAERYDIGTVPTLFIIKDSKVIYQLGYPPKSHSSQKKSIPEAQKTILLAVWWGSELRRVIRQLITGT